MPPEKTPAEIAVERDERDLYLSDPDLYAALVSVERPTIHLTAAMAQSAVLNLTPDEPPPLRTVVERLGYAMTDEIVAILDANPTGPWSLADLETMFGAHDAAQSPHPHAIQFAEWVGIDDGDEDTRL